MGWTLIIRMMSVITHRSTHCTERDWTKRELPAVIELIRKLFWIKMNRKCLVKVSKSQVIKVRRHTLTLGEGLRMSCMTL